MKSAPGGPNHPEGAERLSSCGGPPISTGESQPWPRLRLPLIYGLVLGIAALTAAFVVARGQAGFWEVEGEGTVVQDFASHRVFARGVWRGDWREGNQDAELGSAYSVGAHLRIMSDWMGQDVSFALPFGYSPTMLWLLLPLTLLSVPLAFVVWTAAGALAGAKMLSNMRFHWIVGLMVLVTPIAAASLALGQTGFLGTVAVFFLAHRTLLPVAELPAWRTRDGLFLAVILWALSAKPPLALTAGAAMLAVGAVGPVVLAVVLSLLGAALVTPWMGYGWLPDYATLIGTYDRIAADAAFAWSLRPDHMSNLRAFLSVDLGVPDDLASRVSNLLWIVSLGLVGIGGWRGWIRPPAVWALAILSYLLFCSHVSSTDEILLVVVPALVLPWGSEPRGGLAYLPWIAVPMGLLLSPALGPAAGTRPSILFFVELGLAVWLITALIRGRTHRPPPAPGGGQPSSGNRGSRRARPASGTASTPSATW